MFTTPPSYQTVRGRGMGDTTPSEPLTPEVVPVVPAGPEGPMPRPGMQAQSPPSTYAVADFLDGADGSTIRLGALTALRSVFIAPGLWIAAKVSGVPLSFGQVVGLSLASSATITAGMLGMYAIRRRGQARV
jgi:hypothetical protein